MDDKLHTEDAGRAAEAPAAGGNDASAACGAVKSAGEAPRAAAGEAAHADAGETPHADAARTAASGGGGAAEESDARREVRRRRARRELLARLWLMDDDGLDAPDDLDDEDDDEDEDDEDDFLWIGGPDAKSTKLDAAGGATMALICGLPTVMLSTWLIERSESLAVAWLFGIGAVALFLTGAHAHERGDGAVAAALGSVGLGIMLPLAHAFGAPLFELLLFSLAVYVVYCMGAWSYKDDLVAIMAEHLPLCAVALFTTMTGIVLYGLLP